MIFDSSIATNRLRRRGFTIVELLVVIAIVGVLLALILPAVQAARESARRIECANHLKQIGIAFHLHHDIHRHFPSNGWGWEWAGDSRRGFDQMQPGSWCFNVLPFLEQESARDLASAPVSTAQLLQTPIEVFYCSSRRGVKNYPVRPTAPLLHNAVPVNEAARPDYAVCAGDSIINTPAGPPSTNPVDLNSYAWPPFRDATGVSYVRTEIGMAAVTDGTSHTAMVGEKYIARPHYASGNSLGDDQSAFVGDDADNRRWADEPPQKDSKPDDIQHFGSAHSGGCYFVLADGSTRLISYTIDATVFKNFGNRHDGNPIDLGQ
jgi:prepilin-type N-terminal cleavage/methylation domain-containing protein